MAVTYCVVGDSGTGKSTSIGQLPELGIEGLDPKETAYINVMDKPLPFKGSRKSYGKLISQGGNYAQTSKAEVIIQILEHLKDREDIRNVVLDDAQYILADEFMAKALEKGYDKFSSIGKHGYDVISAGRNLRPDQNFIFLSHGELDSNTGSYKVKTIGKMLDEKITLEGLFTVVLYAIVEYDPKESITSHYFITNRIEDRRGNIIPAKSPVGMFTEIRIPNDMGFVIKMADEYYNG